MPRPAWTWADYERCRRAEERRAAKQAKAVDHVPDAGKMVAVPSPPPPASAARPAPAKIDLSRAPSGMERLAESWKGRK